MKMKNLISLLLLTLTLFFISVCSKDITQTQFVFRWPETHCKAKTAKCTNFRPLKFTLEGFWGADSDGNKIVTTSCKNLPRDWNQVFTNEMVAKLDKFWPSLTAQENTVIWKNAWKTYGCVMQIFEGPTEYFNKAIELANKIGDLLQNHLINSNGIVPCDSAIYNNNEILESFKQVSNNKDVFFTCKEIQSTKNAYLNQITFCYNKDAENFENCPANLVRNKNCRVTNIIVPRPATPPPQLVVFHPSRLFKQLEKSLNPTSLI